MGRATRLKLELEGYGRCSYVHVVRYDLQHPRLSTHIYAQSKYGKFSKFQNLCDMISPRAVVVICCPPWVTRFFFFFSATRRLNYYRE